jgi:hypothetical protein
MRPPVELEPIELKRVSRLVEYNMTGNNHWASYANDWLLHKEAASKFKTAETEIRAIMPDDALSASGYRICAKRDKANRVRITELSSK